MNNNFSAAVDSYGNVKFRDRMGFFIGTLIRTPDGLVKSQTLRIWLAEHPLYARPNNIARIPCELCGKFGPYDECKQHNDGSCTLFKLRAWPKQLILNEK